jgi:hypothetical protein
MGREREQANLSDVLALMTENYHKYKDGNYKELFAKLCIGWIDKAYYYGVIKEGNGLIRKHRECSEENEGLKRN